MLTTDFRRQQSFSLYHLSTLNILGLGIFSVMGHLQIQMVILLSTLCSVVLASIAGYPLAAAQYNLKTWLLLY